MGIDITALTTNADKLGECIDKNKKQEQDRKDEQLYGIIERKVKKEEHKREKPRGQDGTLKKCKRLFEKDASPEVLTKLEESLREQEKYYRYYVQCFLPVLDKAIERSKKISNETKERVKQAISEITYNSRYCFTHNRRDSETESGYGSDVEDDHEVEISNEITNNNALLLKAIKNGNNRKFRKYLKDCTDISSIKAEEGKNILHLIASLEKKQKCKFLGTLIKTVTKEDLAQLINSENQTPFQVALINKVTKEKHESNTIRSNDNTLKFLTKLLEHGASSDNLGLSTKKLQDLKEEQKTYYRNFLEKLAEQGKNSKLKPEIKINTEAKIKEIIPRTINTPDSNDNYQLHLAIKNNDKELFKELLQKGADISLKDTDDNNALHLIVKPETKQTLKLLHILLEASQKEQFIKAVNDKKEGQTPLHQVLQCIQEKSENRSLKKFEKTKRYKTLELLLQNGADITVQDKDEKNALHYIASFKGEQKVACLKLTLGKDEFSKAINAVNGKEQTPLHQVLQRIQEKSKEPSLKNKIKNVIKKEFKDTGRYKTLELFLQNGADITVQDKDEKNALHYIASFKGEQKVACLKLTLGKDEFSKAINAVNGKEQTPLHQVLQRIQEKSKEPSLKNKIKNVIKKEFKDTGRYKTLELFLQNGADITVQDKDEKNALHYIASFKGEQKVACLKLTLGKDEFSKAINAVNGKEQTPLHQVLQRIQEKSKEPSLKNKIKNVIKKEFKDTGRYKTLELFLQNGADITVQDKDGKNALRHIALLKGEQKVTCLELILNSVEKEKFSKAANATNEKERTPLQVALITKTTKDKHNLVNPKSRDNTIKFCVKLLQNGVDPKQLILPERLWSKEYYKTIKGIEKSMGRALIPDDMRTELKCNFGRKLKARDIVKYINNVACKAVTTLVFAALACAAIFSASQGIITIATASSIIAVIGVCYLIYLNLENIYEGFGKIKGKFTEEKQLTLQDNAPKNDTQCNNSVKDIENKSNDLEEQEVQKSSNQSECAENPATKMSDISILRQFINKLRWAD